MNNYSTPNRDRETAYLGAHAAAFTCSEHLSGRARLSGMTDDEARTQLEEARERMAEIRAALKPAR